MIDKLIIQGCLNKNRKAQKDLYVCLLPYLNAIARRYLYSPNDVQDVLQEAFINVFQNIENYDAQKSAFKTWSVKILINCCLKNNHKNQKNQTIELHDYQGRLIGPDVLEKLSKDDMMLFLKKMPLKYFEVFNLFIIDGFSHKEIAKILDIDISLSRKRLSRAKEWLSVKTGNINIKSMLI